MEQQAGHEADSDHAATEAATAGEDADVEAHDEERTRMRRRNGSR